MWCMCSLVAAPDASVSELGEAVIETAVTVCAGAAVAGEEGTAFAGSLAEGSAMLGANAATFGGDAAAITAGEAAGLGFEGLALADSEAIDSQG